jgi:hypothetical protein
MNESRPIEDYLDELRRKFPWGRRFKGRVLSEVEDHLREGVRYEREGNVPSPEAERRVIERFGSPRLVARRFAEDLTGGGARAVAKAMILVVVRVVMDLRLAPPPTLGELLGLPANGFFEPRSVAGRPATATFASGQGRGATRVPGGPRRGGLRPLALVTFAVSGVADTVFMFQRAEEVPARRRPSGTPSSGP